MEETAALEEAAALEETAAVDSLEANAPLPEWNALLSEWNALLSQAQALAKQGATQHAATDAQKWSAGDAIAAMDAFVRHQRTQALETDAPETAAQRELRKLCGQELDQYLTSQPVTPSTLRDYASVARQFPGDHPMRHSHLSFSHARAIRVLPTDELRRKWIRRAEEDHLAVGSLRDGINVWRAAQGEALKAAKGGGRRGVYFCAATGRRITDLSAMATLQLNRLPAARAGFSPPLALKTSGAHAAGSLLRFESLAALGAWIAMHHDTTEAGSIPITRNTRRRSDGT